MRPTVFRGVLLKGPAAGKVFKLSKTLEKFEKSPFYVSKKRII